MKMIPIVLACLSFTGIAMGSSSPAETVAMQAWVNAKFGDAAPVVETGSLSILSHFDIVWQNCRVDRPLALGSTEYGRGLFTHAPAEISYPVPAGSFRPMGVDTNDQTREEEQCRLLGYHGRG